MVWKSLKSIKVRGRDCFLPENDHQGFDDLKPINILIGKNNSGKSKLLDFIKFFVNENSNQAELRLAGGSSIEYIFDEVFLPLFRRGNIGYDIFYQLRGQRLIYEDSAEDFAKNFLFKKIVYFKDGNVDISIEGIPISPVIENNFNSLKKSLSSYANIFLGYKFLEIKAERDVKPEGIDPAEFDFNMLHTAGGSMLTPNGDGLSKLIAKCLVTETARSKKYDTFVEETFLRHINSVLFPDTEFTRITAKMLSTSTYEISLQESNKGQINLSNCGSGIKTVLFVMTILHLIPKISGHRKYVLALEELENNLHPALERRLLAHIRDHVNQNPDILLFLTTHSNVAIDLFGKDKNAQITRVWNDGKASYAEKADTWDHKNNLLDDLGVRASDLLQANCIVWLEGPSDRVYFDKWIEIFSDGKIERGVHYECAFYGGSNLAHHAISAEDEDVKSFIQMLKVNRNSIILMDSDVKNDKDTLKHHVIRVLKESTDKDSVLAWVSAGKEVENYIPDVVLSEYFGTEVKLKQNGLISALYRNTKKGKTDFSAIKVKFANEIIQCKTFSKDTLKEQYDLGEKMKEVLARIQKHNS
jgi:putative ATP-dependent endonuclease of OLD family